MTPITLTSCENKKNYQSATTVVIDIKHRHKGKGFYKLEVYYRYFNGSDTITGKSFSDGLERSYTAKYVKGDSLLIGFNLDDSTDTYFIRQTYAKPRIRQ